MSDVDSIIKLINKGRGVVKLQPLYEILGLNELYWVRVLCQLLVYHPLTGQIIESSIPNPESKGLFSDEICDNSRLVLGQVGLPSTSSPYTQSTAWPYSPYITLTYNSPTSGTLEWLGHAASVQCSISGTALTVDWPDECAVRGDVDTEGKAWGPGTQFTFLPPLSYPAVLVAAQLKTSGDVFALCEEVDYAAELVHAGSDIETVAIAMGVLYKHLS